jgi:hypothetical protein
VSKIVLEPGVQSGSRITKVFEISTCGKKFLRSETLKGK